MADEDNKTTSQNTTVQGQSELQTQLNQIQDQLKAMNQAHADSLTAIANSMKTAAPAQRVQITSDDLYDPAALEQKITVKGREIANEIVQKEREINSTIYNLSQDYPEISTDPAMQKSVRETLASLPKELQNTSIGYETAVLKAVSKAGLIPKGKRVEPVDDGVAISRGRGNPEGRQRGQGKTKLDEATIAFARALGRPVDNPEYLKSLESVSQRDFRKYR